MNLFTKVARHENATVIFITQNMFHQGGHNRTRNLNVQYLVIFRNPRDNTVIDFIARQAFPRKTKFIRDAFDDATLDTPHGYLFFDFTQECLEELRVRTNIFSNDGIVIYKQKNKDREKIQARTYQHQKHYKHTVKFLEVLRYRNSKNTQKYNKS